MVCLLLMTKPFGCFIWAVLADPGTRRPFNFIDIATLGFNYLYPSFTLHVLEIENITALCDSEKGEPHIEQSVYLQQPRELHPGLSVQECIYLPYSF